MSFDAGSIVASMEIRTAQADADLRKIEDRVKRLEDTPHVIKISAVFDNAATGRARAAFAQLDNMISRDAMQRLRSSPQGSILGALNALFSPHPVSGAPSPQQSASQGMLGKIFSPQGGGSASMPAGTASGTTTVVRDVVTGNAPPKAAGGQQGAQGSGQAARDLSGAAGQLRDSAGRFTSAADKTSAAAGDTATAARDLSGASSGVRGLLGSLKGIFGGGGSGDGPGLHLPGGGKSSGGGSSGSVAGNLAGGIGPGIAGVGTGSALKIGGIGTALATLPALAGAAGAGMGAALIGAMSAVVVKGSPALTAQFKAIGTDAQKVLESAGEPLVAALSKALAGVPAFIKSLQPQIAGIFKDIAPQIGPIFKNLEGVVKDLVSLAQAAAPAFGPVVNGLLKLVQGVLPGITAAVRAFTPFASQFAGFLGVLGADIGKFFAAAAPAIGASMKVLGALLDVVGSLLPVIMKLADTFARTLAPIITQLAGALKALTPFLTILGNLFAQLAGAVLTDLVAAFTALSKLLTAIAPSLAAFAQALTGVFTLMENSGVFATLGDALENIVPLIANLVDALLKGLTPVLPPLIAFFTQISNIMIGAFTSALQAILPPLTQLATDVLQALAKVLPVVVPVLAKLLTLFTAGLATVITGVANGLASLLNAIPPGVLQGVAVAILGIVTAVKLWAAAQAALNVLAEANPYILLATALAAVGAAFYLAWEKSAGFRNVMKDIATGFLQAGVIIVSAAKTVVDTVLSTIGTILHGLADAFGWVPGLGGALHAASKSFDDFKSHVDSGMQGAISTMKDWQQQLYDSQHTADQTTSDIVNAFDRQGTAASNAKASLAGYTSEIEKNGVSSAGAQAARQQLITDMTSAGVNAATAQTDIGNYTNAVVQNGVNSDAAKAARQQLASDIAAAVTNSQNGQRDVAAYTRAVQDNGAKSSAAQSARAQLIADLEKAGLNAQQATDYVNGLTGAIKGMPKAPVITIKMTGNGSWVIQGGPNSGAVAGGGGHTNPGMASGGKVPGGYGGGDRVLIRAEPGETVLPKEATSDPMTVAVAKKYGVPGFASGGIVPSYSGDVPGMGPWATGNYNATITAMQDAMIAAMQQGIAAATAAAISTAGVSNASALAALQSAAAKRGWTGAQWQALYNIEMREAGFSLTATNPSSGAYGMAQFIQGPSEYYQYGGDPGTAAGQAVAMVNYIAARYGTPAAAWAHEQQYGWYDRGGLLMPGLTMAVNGTGQPEAVIPGSGMSLIQELLKALAGHMSNAVGWLRRIAGHGWTGQDTAGTGLAGQVNAAAGYPGSGAAFGLDRAALGLPPPAPASSSASASGSDTSGGADTGTADTGTADTGTVTSTPAPAALAAAPKPAQTGAQKNAAAAVEKLIGGYIWHNQLGQARQAVALLDWLGVTKYDSQVAQIGFLDGLLAGYQKKKNTKAVAATEKLLASYGVHVWKPVTTASGNAPQAAAVKALEALMKADITGNDMTAAGQADALLTHLGVGKYTSTLSQIRHLDSLLAQYRKKKDSKDVAATEALLRTYGVRKFAEGGPIPEPVIGFGPSGHVYQFAERGTEYVVPGGGNKLDRLAGLLAEHSDLLGQLIRETRGVGGAFTSAGQQAAFARRYPRGGS